MEYHNVLPKSDETQKDQDDMDCNLDQGDDVESMCLPTSSSSTHETRDNSGLQSEVKVDDRPELQSFFPCVHEKESCDESCSCFRRGILCEASCACFKDCNLKLVY
ncbi:unnamed protein product [Orchesella dallaii]|uniref:Tesmin/TSO1-like CXC domain-containing protein n=1 Tax=Orchesella dallaii TaxID=48710 RepID=A0ABP1QVY5_9HEXA